MKHKLSAVVLAHTLAIVLSGPAFAQTSADINQSGQGNTAYTEQDGNSAGTIAATIVQSGTNNRAGNPDSGTVSLSAGGILQKDNRGNTTAEVRQTGNSNMGMVRQEGVSGKYARVTQNGNSNTGTIVEQGGTGGGAALAQNGDDNSAAITVRGSLKSNPINNSGVVEVSQFSRGNRAEVVHMGPGKTTLVQAGSYNTAKLDSPANLISNLLVEQYGRDNTVSASSLGSVRQYGAGNSAMLLGDVNIFRGPSDAYGTRGDIAQIGSYNSASINQTWSAGNGFASIDQAGSNNTASITGGGRFGSRVEIGQQGIANSASISQSSFSAGTASIDQRGVSQRSTITQTGFQGGKANTVQTGTNNVATISQVAIDEAMILQNGNRNQALVSQVDSGLGGLINVAIINQQGNDLQAAIRQDGSGNRAAIRQR